MFVKAIVRSLLAVLVFLAANAAMADTFGTGASQFTIDFVTVGNPGNAPDYMLTDPQLCGAVAYSYRIGKYEVTADQWAAVVAADPSVGNAGYWSGSQPTAGTSWNEAAKFCNWLTTGHYNQGYYTVDGSGAATSNGLGHDAYAALHGKTYFIPTENEWYKAAYYDGTTGVYYDYPTGSDSVPDGIDFAGDTAFDAVFLQGYNQGQPNSVSNGGAASPYGTIAQGGNIFEWNETPFIYDDSTRGCSGGAWYHDSNTMRALNSRGFNYPADEHNDLGFRVASVPEPSSIVMLAGIALTASLYWWRKCV